MKRPVLVAEKLSKRYKIGRPQPVARSWRASLAQAFCSHLSRLRLLSEGGRADDFIWALRDVSLQVHPGEVVGIIGRNGAGKSTLLKMLSRIVFPTVGHATIHGRVGSLLEVGTGFHPELTGRENIFLNGAVLGMRRTEIRRVFDEIVAFAEIEKFLDTPVKRYSSGMYVRLAFAVAAHLNPEILLVDEVLAVGDIQFQKKCLGKMGDVARSGRTILFISHNMAAVEGLCQRGIVLEGGRMTFDGNVSGALKQYLLSTQPQISTPLRDRDDRTGSGAIRFTSANMRDEDGHDLPVLSTGRDALLELAFEADKATPLHNLQVAIGLDTNTGHRIANLNSEATGDTFDHVPSTAGVLAVSLNRLPLLPGRYHYTIYCTVNGVIADWIQNAGHFDVEAGTFYSTGKLPPGGNFCMDCDFQLR